MRVAVLGATGHTGGRTVAALLDRGIDVVACGRNHARLASLASRHPSITTRRVDVIRREEVERALRDVDGVANLAGPFLDTGAAAVRAAIAAGIPYVDSTGEQAFMRRVAVDLDAAARDVDVAVVNAMAYEYAFADLATRWLFPDGGEALHILYRNRGAHASAGTKKSIVRALAAPALGHEGGKLVRERHAMHARRFETVDGVRDSMSFAGGETLTVPKHTPFRTVRTYVPSPRNRALTVYALAPFAALLLRGPIMTAVEQVIDARHHAPDNATARGEIYLTAETASGVEHALIETPDPYDATAEALAEGIVRLGRDKRAGVLAPAEAFDAATFLDAMTTRMPGFQVSRLKWTPQGSLQRAHPAVEKRL